MTTPFIASPSSSSPLHGLWLDEPTPAEIGQLATLLMDAVDGGASVGFMSPLGVDRATAYWRGVAEGVRAGHRRLRVVHDGTQIVGTVQLQVDLPDNQTHRADLCKLLVHRSARRRGLGEALVRAAEAESLRLGRTVLVLDTVADSEADRLYRRLGWHPAGDVPRYARMPDGAWCTTRYFYRDLAAATPSPT
jgi:ribosomal protein S18 acetylase RimI-like enzyme